jgi:hypothetical protein
VAINITDEISALDQLLAVLARTSTSSEAEIAREHLDAARWYLLGAMYAEYSFSLSLAAEKLELIPDQEIRENATAVVAKLRERQRSTTDSDARRRGPPTAALFGALLLTW